MPRLIWASPALREVLRLYCFLAEKNTDAAKRAVRGIRDGVKCSRTSPASADRLRTWSPSTASG